MGGDEERKGHPQRHAGLHEADEQWHRRARAERGDDTQRGGHDIGHALAAAGEQRTRAFGGEVGIHHAHDEDHRGEQQQHLGRVVEEELERPAEVAGVIHWQGRHQRLRRGQQRPVDPEPGDGSQQQEGARVLLWQLLRAAGQGQLGHSFTSACGDGKR
jgi:hypothetical protein